jgi:uncharacterized phage protein gp47/JayE
MPDLISFMPVVSETLDRIRARLNADANAGLSPQDAAYLDTTPGGFWYDLTQAPALEIARLWDALNEMAASCFVAYAWGVYLDEHGVTIGVDRKGAVTATGYIEFTGDVGTVVPAGVQVATEQVDPNVDPVTFQTTVGNVIPTGGVLALPVEAMTLGSAGNVAAGSVTVLLSPIDGVAAITNIDPITGGADVETDELYRNRLILAFTGAHGAGTVADYVEWALAFPGIGYVMVEPLWNGAGTVRVIVTDQQNNTVSQQVVDALQGLLDPFAVETLSTGTNTFPTAQVNVQSTSGFMAAGDAMIGMTKFSYSGLTPTAFTGVSNYTGTQSYPAGSYVTQSGLGHGLAPIGAIVTVATPQILTVAVACNVIEETGYTLDGAGGTIPLADDIAAAVADYIGGLRPGDDVIVNAVNARIMDVEGVHDVSGTTLNGIAANLSVGSLQVAEPGLVTLT